jgi:hypothetical protein
VGWSIFCVSVLVATAEHGVWYFLVCCPGHHTGGVCQTPKRLFQWIQGIQCFVEPNNLTNRSCSSVDYPVE